MPQLSVIVPVFNEKDTIVEILDRIREVEIDKEIIVVDDCSTDGTRDVLRQLDQNEATVLYQALNQGKGAAVRAGLHEAKGEILVIQDADLEYDPAELPKLIKPIIEERAEAVYGSRFRHNAEQRVVKFWHFTANRALTLLSNMITNLHLTDMETGYKAFRADVLKSLDLQENRFGIEPEITAKLANRKVRVYEVGITYASRTYAEGKKIRLRDGLAAVWCILKYGLRR